jgi:hypothetical protein
MDEDNNYLLHTANRPFCYEDDCPCHEDQELISDLEQDRQDGLVSDQDCDNIYHGRTV